MLNVLAVVAPRLAGLLVWRAFRRTGPRAVPRPDEVAVHAQALVETVTVGGLEVVTYRWGDGARPVLLLHGWQSRASRFAALITRLRALGYTAVAFDAPGNGDSPGRTVTAFDYRDTARELQRHYGPFEAIVAHSFGVLAAFLMLRSGIAAGRLVTISGAIDFDLITTLFASRAGLGPRVERQLRRHIERRFAHEPDLWRRLRATHDPHEITVPILVVHDEGDRVVNVAQARTLAGAYDAQLITTHGLGHHRILSDPAVLDATVDFIGVGDRA